jgi:HK97 family phage major capsid protein
MAWGDDQLAMLRQNRDNAIHARSAALGQRQGLADVRRKAGRNRFTEGEKSKFDEAAKLLVRAERDIADIDARIEHIYGEQIRSGVGNSMVQKLQAARGGGSLEVAGRDWAYRAAATLQRIGGESRAVVSGSFDVPHLISPNVTPMVRPRRLIDLLVNRLPLDGTSFEYFRQSIRTNNAAPVADNATKPTSTLTLQPITDRARVIAHLSEPAPIRLLSDVAGLQGWLVSDLAEGVLDALEYQVIRGDATGENFEGLLNGFYSSTPNGTRQVAFATDAVTSLRKALTLAQTVGEEPNAVVLSPADAEAIDLTRWGASGGFLTGGFANDTGNGFGTSANIFGSPEIQRVISPSMPAGVAVLGDFSKIQLMVRESVNVMIDASGVLFTKNEFLMRAEGRFGIANLRPSAFIVVDVAA